MVAQKLDVEVLVVGAGPTGLVMACELARRGIRIKIIDKSDAPSSRSRALVVHARSLELFQKMGIAEQFLEAGQKVRGVNMFVNGRKRASFEFSNMGELDTPYPFLLMVSQVQTEQILEAHLKTLGVTVERNIELEG
jgi:2-polyprenyl-6-methoxyphenol hydroxylase-like FAD-dependent oxidoreductase